MLSCFTAFVSHSRCHHRVLPYRWWWKSCRHIEQALGLPTDLAVAPTPPLLERRHQGHQCAGSLQGTLKFLSWISNKRGVTRITWEWAQAMWALGFVLILWDLIRGIKDGQLTLTKTDSSRTSQIHHDIIHQVQCFIHPMMAHIFNETEPHHPSRTTSSSRALQEVSRGISAEIHRKLTKILGSRLASSQVSSPLV